MYSLDKANSHIEIEIEVDPVYGMNLYSEIEM